MATVNNSEELRTFAEAQAAKKGFASIEEYEEFVQMLILNIHMYLVDSYNRPREPRSRETVLADIAELDRLRVGNRLNGLSIRDLIDEGRRP